MTTQATQPDDTREGLSTELEKILPKSQHKKIDQILELIDQPECVTAVEVNKTHAPIETVELYGLVLGVDANGYAATVSFPDGAEVSQW